MMPMGRPCDGSTIGFTRGLCRSIPGTCPIGSVSEIGGSLFDPRAMVAAHLFFRLRESGFGRFVVASQ